MKTILLSLAAVAALGAAAAPAAAQSWRDLDHGYAGAQRSGLDGLDWKIDHAAQEGRISYGEARGLRAELRQAQSMAWRVQSGRANEWQRRQLDRTVNHIEQALNASRYGHEPRRESYGYGRGFDRDAQAYGSDWRR